MLFCINFTRWKQNHIKSFLSAFLGDAQDLQFISNAQQAEKKGFNSDAQLISWASKDQTEANKIAYKWGGDIWFVEDGFIRSTGLGTDLTAPASLVLDKSGIYYDPEQPSDLEKILQDKTFSESEISRAKALRKGLIANQLSKYNLGNTISKNDIKAKPNQRVILIPGQVEGDASIRKGCVDVNSNSKLIEVVRNNNSDNFIIYKPHPDVVSGNRKGKVEKQLTDKLCDLVLDDVSITDCLDIADEVHTMTSLVGFEALMRDLKVVCYGLPFYSNWGLTTDRHALPRRTRKLTLDELVAGTLIDYPLYINWQTNQLTAPEVIIQQLKQQLEKQGGKQSNQVPTFTRAIRKTVNFIKGTIRLN